MTDNRASSCPTDNADEAAQEEHQIRAGKLEGYKNDIEYSIREASSADWQGMQLLQQIDAFNLDKDYGADKAREAARKAAKFSHLDEDSIPSKKDPKENAKWWSSLTEQQRQAYLDATLRRSAGSTESPARTATRRTARWWILSLPTTT